MSSLHNSDVVFGVVFGKAIHCHRIHNRMAPMALSAFLVYSIPNLIYSLPQPGGGIPHLFLHRFPRDTEPLLQVGSEIFDWACITHEVFRPARKLAWVPPCPNVGFKDKWNSTDPGAIGVSSVGCAPQDVRG